MGQVIPFPYARRLAARRSRDGLGGLPPLYVDGTPGVGASLEDWEFFRWRLVEFDQSHPEVKASIRQAEIMLAIKRQRRDEERNEHFAAIPGGLDTRA
jgi:hypothetical protein